MAASALVGPHLADQLMLPMALAGAGQFITTEITEHARTNAAVIAQFLPVRFVFEGVETGHRVVAQAA
jgi:RNA 3'-terminal phosphate cyclase (ATP)